MKSFQSLMIQGTTSDAGKSTLVAALGRIFSNRALQVAPFKPQNMALNSAVTPDGGEIGRAQAVQAEACRVTLSTDMNPVLIKPNSDTGAQIIVNGKPFANQSAKAYHESELTLLNQVVEAFERLGGQYEHVLVEGAGSPAEINLRDRDIANMGFAEKVDCPVILVADIDRGGVFAHLVGTLDCLSDSECDRIKGFIINRFRGDIKLLESGLDWLEQKTNKPVLGVVPYIENMHIEAEDSIPRFHDANLKSNDQITAPITAQIKIVVPALPRISNHTDFDPLRLHPDVELEFIKDPDLFTGADLIILPGTKSVMADMRWLRESGWLYEIEKHLRYGGKLIGICGGMQMMGAEVQDPQQVESPIKICQGFGWLDIVTVLESEKQLFNVEGELQFNSRSKLLGWNRDNDKSIPIKGYEIHQGITFPIDKSSSRLSEPNPVAGTGQDNRATNIDKSDFPFLVHLNHIKESGIKKSATKLQGESKKTVSETIRFDGYCSDDGQIFGTYVHGLFESHEFMELVLDWCRLESDRTSDSQDSSFSKLGKEQFSYEKFKDHQFNRLAQIVEESVDIEQILKIMSAGA